jgi:hypothetical protein
MPNRTRNPGLLGGLEFGAYLPSGAVNLGLLRPDATQKGIGLLGPLNAPSGDVMTEYSVGMPDGMDVPSIVPTLTRDELRTVLNGDINDGIYSKAVTHALDRMWQGKSPFQRWNEPIHSYPER